MPRGSAVLVLLLVTFGTRAYADCAAEVGTAMHQAEAMPASPGRAALQEQILRANNAHHEGDEEGCVEELSVAKQAIAEVAKRQ